MPNAHAALGNKVLKKSLGVTWSPLRVLAGGFGGPGWADGQLNRPFGLRLTGDGTGLAVVDRGNNRVSLFRVADGCFDRHLTAGLRGLKDILEVEECEGGWLVACSHPSNSSSFVSGGVVVHDTLVTASDAAHGFVQFHVPGALALVPGLGLAVRDSFRGGRVLILAAPDALAVASMSAARVAWMVAVVRGRQLRWGVAPAW